MIRLIDVTNQEMAKSLLEVQLPAYKVEAELIGFDGIPALKDTVETLSNCGETFYGYFIDEELAGAISYKEDEEMVDIHRLIVHPDHFRKGIGKELVSYILDIVACGRKVIVSTGAQNYPAMQLYRSLGFEEKKDVEVGPGIFVTLLERVYPLK